MTLHQFDDSTIQWKRFGEFVPSFHFSILNIDEKRRVVDVLFKLPANEQIVLHRHLVLNHTFVVQGEHLIYETDGKLRERRSTASLTVSPASEKPHREGGGEHDTIVYFSIRPDDKEDLYELLDDNLQPIGTVTYQMLVDLYKGQ
ncbi:regulator [Ampullimonas aquatilis]|uniref:regulator n=1 Tax=Ampullimonas aquatilis TaxID=1341549 RepID=UPI003C792855